VYELHDLVTHFWLKRKISMAVSVPGRRRRRAGDHAEATVPAEATPDCLPTVSRGDRADRRRYVQNSQISTHTRLDRPRTNKARYDLESWRASVRRGRRRVTACLIARFLHSPQGEKQSRSIATGRLPLAELIRKSRGSTLSLRGYSAPRFSEARFLPALGY
jgi:hypothetical protein